MHIVPYADIRAYLTVERVLEPVRDSFKAYSAGLANIPPVQHLEMPYLRGGALHIKSGHVRSQPFCVVKIASTFPDNPTRPEPLPSIGGVIVVFETETGLPVAILDDRALVTQIRTAAAGAIAAELFARPGAQTLGVIGSGVQARLQCEAIRAAVPSLERVLVWGRTPAHVQRYVTAIEQFSPSLRGEVCSEPEHVVTESDILVTTTYATSPIVRGEWLPPGVLVIAMGADSSHKRELDTHSFVVAESVIVDSRSQNLVLGEIPFGIGEGAFDSRRIDAEIGEVLNDADGAPRRRSPHERIICKLTGIAVQDVFVSGILLQHFALLATAPARS